MQPVLPSWFKQRQANAEPAGDNLYKLTGPNLPETFITIRQVDNGRWQAALLQSPTGPDIAVSETAYEHPADAWGAAFELHRVHVMV